MLIRTFLLVLTFFIAQSWSFAVNKNLINVNEENWRDILKGEWMIEFHAPWCPACRDLRKAWNSFADWSEDLRIHVAEIDVTTSPGLSGRFLVTALPTIIHVKDGVFRQYLGSRDKEDFVTFIEDKKWSTVPSIPSWKYPDSPQMTVVSYFFKLSMSVRDLHNYLVEKQGIPSWGSYAIFGITTLVLGCILGFVIVYFIDYLFPTTFLGEEKKPTVETKDTNTTGDKGKTAKNKKQQKKQPAKTKDKNSDDEDESDVEKIDNTQSEGENSGSADESARRRKKTKKI